MQYMHKAVRPKKDYINPTLCRVRLKDEASAHKNSVTRWDKVTCPHCLAIMSKQYTPKKK